MSARILVFAGSVRLGSFNRRLAAEAARRLALTNATVTLIELSDYPLTIYDEDAEEEEGIPDAAMKLAERIAEQDGLLLVSPEYNASLSPLLKNVIDWTSRVRKIRGRPVQPWRRLVVGLAAASPGRLGGMRGLAALRPVCQALGAELLTPQVTVPDAANAFDERGRPRDQMTDAALDALLEQLLAHCRSLGRHQP